jgi:hypothetical protein
MLGVIRGFAETPWPYLELAAVTGACSSLIGGIIARKGSRDHTLTHAQQRWAWSALLVATQVVFTAETVLSALLTR